MAASDKTKPDLLIVDDDPLITETLNFVLSRDFSVYVAESRNHVKSLLRQLDTNNSVNGIFIFNYAESNIKS